MKHTIKITLIAAFFSSIFLTGSEKVFFGPHLTSVDPWINRIYVLNAGDQAAPFQLKIWNMQAQVQHDQTYTVPARDSIVFVMTQFSEVKRQESEIILDPIDGTFLISTSSESLAPLLSFQFGDSPSLSQFFLTETTGYQFTLPNMKSDYFSWTGMAIMNSHDESLDFTLDALKGGAIISQAKIEIPARSKYVALSDQIWAGVGISGFDQVRVSCAAEIPAPILITGNADQDRHVFFMGALTGSSPASGSTLSYPVVDTGQTTFYNASTSTFSPDADEPFYGQDASYIKNPPSYSDNGDGTVTDEVTGLMWQKDPGAKMTLAEAMAHESSFSLAGYDDWRLPTIKELYSLINFNGLDPSGYQGTSTNGLVPFIDTDSFVFEYGDTSKGERIIDSQMATSTIYTSTTMGGNETMFGVNFADGRIKGYPTESMGPDGAKTYFVYYVRGNPEYGKNDFQDNGNGTITDHATGLMWMELDSGSFSAGENLDGALNWEQALAFAETMDYAGHSDWRLPNAKELQSIVDYSRSPDATGSAAIDPKFNCTAISNEGGDLDYPFYWSSTTHANMSPESGGSGAYVSFGRALGYWNGEWTDVHGAGAQRSDPKTGDPADWPTGHGPQGDAIRIYNYVRCVRDISTEAK